MDISVLEKRIGYTFKDKEILKEALTHSSYANELKARRQSAVCNERLEFLGDSVLSLVVSKYIFENYRTLPEGELTRIRAALVQSGALASYARELELGKHLLLGNGEEKNKGRERQSTLENAFEALLAAIYIDAGDDGFNRVFSFLEPILKNQLDGSIVLKRIDAKTELQQLIQQAEGDFLEYVVIAERGPDHQKEFEVVAKLNSNVIGRGKGRSKREAEQNAAREALALFGEI